MLPDILTRTEIERLINGARELRYQTFILTAYSMGLRLGEVLNLQPGDIDSARMKVHVRQGKGKFSQGLSTFTRLQLFTRQRQAFVAARTVGIAGQRSRLYSQAEAAIHLLEMPMRDVACELYPTATCAAINLSAANTAIHVTRGKEKTYGIV